MLIKNTVQSYFLSKRATSPTVRQTIVSSTILTLLGLYIFQYIPVVNPSSAIPPIPLIWMLLLSVPLFYLQQQKRIRRFLRKPRSVDIFFIASLPFSQREQMSRDYETRAIERFSLGIATALTLIITVQTTLLGIADLIMNLFLPLSIVLELLLLIFVSKRSLKSTRISTKDTQQRDFFIIEAFDRIVRTLTTFCRNKIYTTKAQESPKQSHTRRLWLYISTQQGLLFIPLYLVALLGAPLLIGILKKSEFSLTILPLLLLLIPTGLLLLLQKSFYSAVEMADKSIYYNPKPKELEQAIRRVIGTIVLPFLLTAVLALFLVPHFSLLLWLHLALSTVALMLLFSSLYRNYNASDHRKMSYVGQIILLHLSLSIPYVSLVIALLMIVFYTVLQKKSTP